MTKRSAPQKQNKQGQEHSIKFIRKEWLKWAPSRVPHFVILFYFFCEWKLHFIIRLRNLWAIW